MFCFGEHFVFFFQSFKINSSFSFPSFQSYLNTQMKKIIKEVAVINKVAFYAFMHKIKKLGKLLPGIKEF